MLWLARLCTSGKSRAHVTGARHQFPVALCSSALRLLEAMASKEYSTTSATSSDGKLNAPEGYKFLKEGNATILQAEANEVFYNPAQVVNRDLSIAVLRLFDSMRRAEIKEGKLKRTRTRGGHPGPAAFPEVAERCNIVLPVPPPEAGGPAVAEKMDTEASPTATEGAEGADKGKEETAEKVIEPPVPHDLRILEGMAASGLRAIRYAAELEDVAVVVANDMDPAAVDAIKRNLPYNQASGAAERIMCQQGDVRVLMMQMEKSFDVVDLDPYGSPAQLLDSAMGCAVDGGLLMITATDMAILCGNNKEVCWSKYGSYPLRSKFCHELALRILLASIEQHANRHKRHIVPQLSISVDFYIRVFVRIYTSPATVKYSATKLCYLYQCVGCETFEQQSVARAVTKGSNTRFMPGKAPTVANRCGHCGWEYNMGGPFWSQPLHDPDFVKRLLKSVQTHKGLYPAYDQIHAKLITINEELKDVPFFYCLHGLSATLKCTAPPSDLFRSAVVNAGYRCSSSHVLPTGVKTDAPAHIIWDIMRCWVKDHPVKATPEATPGSKLLEKEPEHQAIWTRNSAARSKAQQQNIPRFPPNPQENWGPKARAMGKAAAEKERAMAAKAAAKADQPPAKRKRHRM